MLTTKRFMMTTALKSLYVQIEMPDDTNQRSTSTTVLQLEGRLLRQRDPDRAALTDHDRSATRRPRSRRPTNDRHAAAAPARSSSRRVQRARRCCSSACSATRRSFAFRGNTTICNDHASKPYFTADDVSDWRWVTITPKASAADRTPVIQPYDLPALRAATTLALSLPRVGFYTTPAFLALWNTNDSNQHRVTANQTLLVALGQSFTSRQRRSRRSRAAGLDASHAVAGTECYGCHKSAGSDAAVLGQPARLQRPQRLPGGKPFNGPRPNPRPTGAPAASSPSATSTASRRRASPTSAATAGAGDRRRPKPGRAAFAHRGRAEALLLRELVAVHRDRPGVPARRRRCSSSSSYNFAVAGQGAVLVAAGDRRRRRPRPSTGGNDGPDQHRAPRPAVRGAVEPPGQARPLRAGGRRCPTSAQSATLKIAASVAADAFSRGSRVAGHAVEADAVLSRRDRDAVREHRRRRSSTRPAGAVYSSTDVAGRDRRTWSSA